MVSNSKSFQDRSVLNQEEVTVYSNLYKKGDVLEKYIDIISPRSTRLHEVQGTATVVGVNAKGILVEYLANGSKSARSLYLDPNKNRFALAGVNGLKSKTELAH